jgi:peptide/nickel transport system permease protein
MASALIERGVPFLFLAGAENRIPSALNNSIIQTYSLGQKGIESNEILQEIASSIKSRQATGLDIFTKTLFFQKSVRFFWFDFGQSDRQNLDISRQVLTRMGPSLMITVPAFILGLGLNLFIAMIVAYCRGTYVDKMVAIICIILMSIMSLFYYFLAQIVFGVWIKLLPVSGYLPGFNAIRFVLLPIACSVVIGIGGGVRFYRTIFLEETNKDYVTTARAKGLTRFVVLFKHVLKNAMIPILTNVVLVIPMLFVGSLILESFFAIPGLGRFTLEGIHAQDFRIVGSMVYLGAFLYILGLILTDISYTLVDPRIRFE